MSNSKYREVTKWVKIISVLFTLLISLQTKAVIIETELSLVSGNTYQYDFTITNDDLADGIEEFSIYFDYTLFENLAMPVFATDWDGFVAQPDPLLPDDGFFDAFFLVDPLVLGATLSGFSVLVDWLGTASGPGSVLGFDVFDANFNIVSSGLTQPVVTTPPNPVPAPASLLLLVLAGVMMLKKRK